MLQAHPRVAPLWRATKTALKRPALLRAYRQQLGRQQHRDFDVQVRDSRGATPYNEAHTRALLGARAAARRPLRSADGRPDVVAFGFENWERHGFWASLAQTCNLRFVNIGDLSRDAGIHESSEAGRRTLADACLRTIDTLQTQAPVSAAFFYIDSESLSPALFEGLRARRIWSILLCLDD
ncbi:MAG TPA: hypothetical protein VFH51_07595, partial [Myxococcota bacterium]|nr:hypothetical protein [Myxococcota bacterium]